MYRIASIDDLEGINDVIRANNTLDQVYKFPYHFYETKEIEQRDDFIIFVIDNAKVIIGFLILHGKSFQSDGDAEFEIVVHPAHRDRDKHYGEKLLRYAIEYIRKNTKIKTLYALIKKENIPSIKLCKKCSFEDMNTNNQNTPISNGITLKLIFNR